MRQSLNLKTFKIPENLDPAAKAFCENVVKETDDVVGKLTKQHKDHVAWLKQQYKIALRRLRPTFVSENTMRELFDEPELYTNPEIEVEVEEPDKEPKPKKQKRKKKLKAIPDSFPRKVIEHDIGQDIKADLSPMGYDTKLELVYRRATIEIIEHRYLKYVDKRTERIFRQDPEPALIPQSFASPELLAQIAVSKYCDHMPLYRQEKIFRSRHGINLTRQVMADWMIKLGDALNPLIGLMHERILDSPVVSADETPVKILTKDGIRTSSQSYMWQLSRWGPKPLVIFEHDPTRRKEVAEKLLGGYEGFVQIDGYAGYNILFGDESPRRRVGCMAHVLRKFKDLLKSLDKEQRKGHSALRAVKLINELYEIEDACRGFTPEARAKHRKDQGAEAIFEELHQYVADERNAVSKASPYYDALKYAVDELPHISHYLHHGFIEIDNNFAENAIRPFALGRRNWLFIVSEKGAKASANIYSMLITAKANNVEPVSYLTNIIRTLPKCETIEDYEALLPS